MGEFLMITVLSVFAIYGIFDILHIFLFSDSAQKKVRKAVIMDNINYENAEYNIRKYINNGYEIIISGGKDGESELLRTLDDEKIHILEYEIFAQYF